MEIIRKLEKLNETLGIKRNAYLELDAERKHKEAILISSAPGESMAAKTIQGHANPEFLSFNKKLARAEAEYQFLLFQYEIMKLEYQAIYLEAKQNEEMVKRQA